jgi:CheY-like chemotaxis protein
MLAVSVCAGASQNRLLAEEACGEFGTSVTFADSPAEAAKQALKEEKLVFVLHVSGLFEDSDFT